MLGEYGEDYFMGRVQSRLFLEWAVTVEHKSHVAGNADRWCEKSVGGWLFHGAIPSLRGRGNNGMGEKMGTVVPQSMAVDLSWISDPL